MRPALRIQKLAARKTWCQPRSRNVSTTISPYTRDASAEPFLPSDTTAGPSKPRLDSSFFNSSSHDPIGTQRSSSLSTINYRFTEPTHVKELEDILFSAPTKSRGFPSTDHARKVWDLYEKLSPMTRRHLPQEVYRAALIQVIPARTRGLHIEEYPAYLNRMKTFGTRMQTILMDIRDGPTELEAEDLALSMQSLAGHGHIVAVERSFAQIIKSDLIMDESLRQRLDEYRLAAILRRCRTISTLPRQPVMEDPFKQPALTDRPRVGHESLRQQTAASEEKEIFATLLSILKDYHSNTIRPSQQILKSVAQISVLLKDLYPRNEVSDALGDYFEHMLKLNHHIDLDSLTLQGEQKLWRVSMELVTPMLQLLGQRGKVWNMMAAAEQFQNPRWPDRLAELVRTEWTPPKARDVFENPKGVDAESHDAKVSEGSFVGNARSFQTFMPMAIPRPSDMARMGRDRADRSRDEPFHTPHLKRSRLDLRAYKVMQEQIRDHLDLTALAHLMRAYLIDSTQQQAYFIYKASEAYQKERNGDGAGHIDNVEPPAVRFDFRIVAWYMAYLRSRRIVPYKLMSELKTVVQSIVRRLADEHKVITGLPPSGYTHEFELYVENMRTMVTDGIIHPFLKDRQRRQKGHKDLVRYMYNVDQTHAQFTEMLEKLEIQSIRGARSRMRKAEGNLRHRLNQMKMLQGEEVDRKDLGRVQSPWARRQVLGERGARKI